MLVLTPLNPRVVLVLRTAGLALICWTVIGSSPGPGGSGRGLVDSLLLCLAVAAWLVWTVQCHLSRRSSADLFLLAGSGGLLVAGAPQGAGSAFAFVAVATAGFRLDLGRALAVTALGIFTTALGVLIYDSSAIEVLTYGLGLTAVLLAGTNARQTVTRAEEAELLLAQVQRSREEQLRSARLQESTRIAREIHDVLAHALAGLTIQLEATSALIEAGAERGVVLERVRRAHALAREGLEETRHAVGVLRSDGLSVLRALEALMDDYRASAPGASVDLSVDQAAHQLDGPAALAVVRITQEALTNVRKHAPGAAVTVQLRPAHADDGALVLSICDRGGGAAPGHGGSRPHRLDRPDAASNGSSQPSGPALAEGLADSGGGYGLTGMRERAALLGGSLTAGPAADGWLVELRLPAGACEDAAGPRPAGGS